MRKNESLKKRFNSQITKRQIIVNTTFLVKTDVEVRRLG